MSQPDPVAEIDDLLTVRLSRVLPAPRERVFEAWTTPEIIARWWGPHSFRGIAAEADPRPAIELEGADGERHRMAGIYTEVTPPELLCLEIRHRQIEGAAQRPEGYIPTFVRVELREHPEGTELTLTHSGFLDAALAGRFRGGWSGSLDKLETSLANRE
jgi:uncharacterized protein YndB with AHSA1/START domain